MLNVRMNGCMNPNSDIDVKKDKKSLFSHCLDKLSAILS